MSSLCAIDTKATIEDKDEVDRIASTPTGWQDASVVTVTMTKVTV